MRRYQAVLMLWASASVALASGFSGTAALEFTRKAVSFGPRPPGSAADLKLQEYIQAQLKTLRCTVSADAFTASTPVGPVPMKNILAKFPGPVTLQLSMQEWAGAFFLLGLFLGLVMAALLSLSDPIGGADLGMYFAAGFLLIFSVLCMLVSEGLLTTRMTLDAAGFKMRSFGVVTYHRQWKDVRNFTPVTPNNIVVYEDSTRHGFWAEVDRRYLGGFNARLIDTLG